MVADIHGSCPGNGQPNAQGGIGVHFDPNNPYNVSMPLSGDRQTAPRAALEATRTAIEQARAQGYQKVEIRTDSEYVIKGSTEYMQKWQDNDFKKSGGGQVKNADQWQALDRAQKGMDVTYTHVDHKGDYGSQESYKLARDGAKGKYN